LDCVASKIFSSTSKGFNFFKIAAFLFAISIAIFSSVTVVLIFLPSLTISVVFFLGFVDLTSFNSFFNLLISSILDVNLIILLSARTFISLISFVGILLFPHQYFFY